MHSMWMAARWRIARDAAACAIVATIAGCGGAAGGPAVAGSAADAPSTAEAQTASPTTMAPSSPTSGVAATPTSPAAGTGSGTVAATMPKLSPAALEWLDLDLSSLPSYASPALPAHYRTAEVGALDNAPADDPVSDTLATLGRVLFNDRRLSVDDSVACASCHRSEHGFDDPARFSAGFGSRGLTGAHAMRLGNVRFYAPGSMFWDRRAPSLEAQSTMPIRHPVEMGFDEAAGGIAALLAKMAALPYYPELFRFAFGDPAIDEPRIQRALAHFGRSLVSAGSAWDTGYARNFAPGLPDRGLGAPIAGFSASEERGRRLFVDPPPRGGLGCAGCHVPPTFALAASSRSNGLDAGETRVFKSPSLKNVALSRAFMHDGRFSSLEQVIEHYDSGVRDGPALDPRLREPGGGPPRRLGLSPSDKAALVAFLGTLTDTAFASDPKFASPFRR